ncbi:MAG: sensor histidine kinase [Catenulispora sp.]
MDGEEHPGRLARVLHDHVCGQVGIALRNLELYELHHDDDPVWARRRAQTAQEVLQDLLATLGTVLLEVDGRGSGQPADLGDALRAVADAFGPGDTVVDVLVDGDQTRLTPAARAELLVVLREGLLNALRHAAAARIRMAVRIGEHEVHAEVTDDGVGIGTAPGPGLGLRSMRYRAAALGGTVTAGDRPGGGTAVRVTVPLTAEAAVR